MAKPARALKRMVLVLLTALVWVQTLGVLHRVVHAHVAHGVAVAEAAGPMDQLQRLWGEHSNAVDCQLFDQSCPDAVHIPAVAWMPVMPAPRWLAATLHERFTLSERFYAARGPPAVWH